MRSECTVHSNLVELFLWLWFLVLDIVFPIVNFLHLTSICISAVGTRLCARHSVCQWCKFSFLSEPSWVFQWEVGGGCIDRYMQNANLNQIFKCNFYDIFRFKNYMTLRIDVFKDKRNRISDKAMGITFIGRTFSSFNTLGKIYRII